MMRILVRIILRGPHLIFPGSEYGQKIFSILSSGTYSLHRAEIILICIGQLEPYRVLLRRKRKGPGRRDWTDNQRPRLLTKTFFLSFVIHDFQLQGNKSRLAPHLGPNGCIDILFTRHRNIEQFAKIQLLPQPWDQFFHTYLFPFAMRGKGSPDQYDSCVKQINFEACKKCKQSYLKRILLNIL